MAELIGANCNGETAFLNNYVRIYRFPHPFAGKHFRTIDRFYTCP